MRHRNVGKLGEGTLQKLASEEDASLTKTGDDRWGWDFLLEFPIEHGPARDEADKEEEVYRCLLQVKSTDSARQYCQVKVSNWRRLVDTPLPTFFLALHFDGARECHATYLVHVWEDEMSRVLKRVRELGVAGEGDRLRKHRLVLRWRDGDKLGANTGKALLQRIRDVVGSSPADYSRRKLQLRGSVGYDIANA